jgi:hypothetical protein
LVSKKLFEAAEPESAIEERIFKAVQANFRKEAEINRAAERVLEENRSLSAGMDQRMLLQKIRVKIAHEQGFVL